MRCNSRLAASESFLHRKVGFSHTKSSFLRLFSDLLGNVYWQGRKKVIVKQNVKLNHIPDRQNTTTQTDTGGQMTSSTDMP